MSVGKRESLLSRRQWVAIWVIVGVITLWIAAYLVLRIGGSRPDSIRPWVGWTSYAPTFEEPTWQRCAPDFPAYGWVKESQGSSIAVAENALPWSVVFHPLQKLEYVFTGRRVYFIDHETNAATGRIHIGATAAF